MDVSDSSIELARTRNPEIDYHHSADGKLPFESASFDVVFAICVWHHVPPDQWTTFISELSRVTVPNGLLLIYEHNPWNPLTRLVVSRCAFDEDAVLVSVRSSGAEPPSIWLWKDHHGLPHVPPVQE